MCRGSACVCVVHAHIQASEPASQPKIAPDLKSIASVYRPARQLAHGMTGTREALPSWDASLPLFFFSFLSTLLQLCSALLCTIHSNPGALMKDTVTLNLSQRYRDALSNPLASSSTMQTVLLLLLVVATGNAAAQAPIQCTPANAATDCVFTPGGGYRFFTVDRQYTSFNIECAGASGGNSPPLSQGGSGAVINLHFSGSDFENTFGFFIGSAGGDSRAAAVGTGGSAAAGGSGGSGASNGGSGGSGTLFSGGGGGADTILLSSPLQKTNTHLGGGGGASFNNAGGNAGLPALAAGATRSEVNGQPGGGGDTRGGKRTQLDAQHFLVLV